MTVTEPPVAEPNGRRRFLIGAGAAVGATALMSAVPTGVVHAAPPDGASRFLPLPAAKRVASTREPDEYDFTPLAANRIRVKVAGANGVAPDATAVVLTVTAVNFGEPNFVTVFPTGVAVPTVSNLNLLNAGDANANLVTVKIGNGGSVDLYSRRPCDMIVDVLGYYEPVTSGVRAAGVIVPVTTIAGKRQIKIFTLHPAKILVDVFGYFTGESSSVSEVGLFMPVNPERLIDTREPGGAVGKLWPNWVVEVPIPASSRSPKNAPQCDPDAIQRIASPTQRSVALRYGG